MSLGIQIQKTDTASEAVDRVRDFWRSEQAANIAGYSARNTLAKYFGQLDRQRPNALSGPRTHYYGDARKATHYQVTGNTVTVAVSQIGFRLHYYGGVVSAGKSASRKTGKATVYLTIPAVPEAHGKSASDFPGLIVLWGRSGPYALGRSTAPAPAVGVTRKTRGTTAAPTSLSGQRASAAAPEVVFWLKKSVVITPDPTVLPPMRTVEENVMRDLTSVAQRRFRGTDLGSASLPAPEED